jgi:hypothetical protein
MPTPVLLPAWGPGVVPAPVSDTTIESCRAVAHPIDSGAHRDVASDPLVCDPMLDRIFDERLKDERGSRTFRSRDGTSMVTEPPLKAGVLDVQIRFDHFKFTSEELAGTKNRTQ